MKKYFFIQPRQSGKTTKALDIYRKSPNDSLFITYKADFANELCKKVNGNPKNFISSMKIKDKTVGYKFIILDEYMFFKNKEEVYENIVKMIDVETIYIYSTSNKQYNKYLYNFVKYCKEIGLSYSATLSEYSRYKGFSDKTEDDIRELYYNFLTDSDIILDDKFKKSTKNTEELINILCKEQYEVEILNKYLTDNLISLEEHNSIINISSHKLKLNGIACPNCGKELFDSQPDIILMTNPPKKHIECGNCGFEGYRNT